LQNEYNKCYNDKRDKWRKNMEFAKLVKEIRIELGMSQDQLSEELHVSFATVNRWENGRNNPNKIAKKVLYDYCKNKGVKKELVSELEY
jgi:DNA-binding transcriptional regulator YiaG